MGQYALHPSAILHDEESRMPSVDTARLCPRMAKAAVMSALLAKHETSWCGGVWSGRKDTGCWDAKQAPCT
jgi:hypothetical protein